jgi:hypothetical protein
MPTDYAAISQGSVVIAIVAAGTFAGVYRPVSQGSVVVSTAAVPTVTTGYSPTTKGTVEIATVAAGSRDFSLVQQSDVVLTFSASPTILGSAITFAEVIDEILTIWGQRCGCCTDDEMLQQAVSIVNSSVQQMWSRARDREYFARKQADVLTDVAGIIEIKQDYVDGAEEIPFQNLSSEGFTLVPTGATNIRLRRLTSRAEWEFFTQMYEGSDTSPKAYYMDITQSNTDQGLGVVQIRVAPNPAEIQEFTMTYFCQAPRFSVNDYTNGRRVALPHTYVESLLLPLVKYEALASFWAVKMEGKDSIQERYAFAQSMMDKIDPAPSGDKPNKQSKHEGDKA